MLFIRKILFVFMVFVGLGDFTFGVDYVGQSRTGAITDAKKAWEILKKEYLKGLESTILYSLAAHPQEASEAKIYIDSQNEYNWYSRRNYRDVTIRVVNTRYSFDLNQKGDNDKWILQELSINSNFAGVNEHIQGEVLWGTSLVFASIMLEDAWLENLIDTDSFQIISMQTKEIDNDDNNYIELVFNSDFLSDDGATKVRGGRIVLIPSLYWVIKHYELDLESNLGKDGIVHAKCSHSVDYQIIDGIPFPKKKEMIYTLKSDGKTINHMNVDYVSIKRGDIPKDILYLSHYGFSEPENPQRRLVVVRIVLMTAGILLILFGLYMRWFATKKK